MTTPRLSASIVTYLSPPAELLRLLESICVAMEAVRNSEVRGRGVATLVIHLIDNADIPELGVRLLGVDKTRLTLAGITLVLHQGWGNVGYGRGHNRVLSLLDSDFHLVLNTDVEMAPTSLIKGIDYLETAPETVLIAQRRPIFLVINSTSANPILVFLFFGCVASRHRLLGVNSPSIWPPTSAATSRHVRVQKQTAMLPRRSRSSAAAACYAAPRRCSR